MTSTVPGVLGAIVTALDAHTDLDGILVSRAWPGPEAEREMVIVGDEITDWTSVVPAMKAGRKQRQESYSFTIEAWVFDPDGTSRTAGTTSDRAVALADVVDDLLADDPTVGLSTVQHVTVESRSLVIVPHQKGWACRAALDVQVEARLS